MKIKRVPISEVEIWEKNPRNIKTKDFERLKRQIQELGVYKPLICYQENGKYVTLGGNMRLRALVALNIKEVDISLVEAPDEATKIKYALSDNDRVGGYDEQALAELAYPHIEEINLEDYRIDVGEPISLKDVIENYAPDIDGEDEVPEIDDSPAITKMGDLFTLGKHRLLCGDATKEEDVKRLMNGKKADMVFTDPLYGIDLDADWSSAKSKLRFYKEKGCQGQGNKYPKIVGDDELFNPTFILNEFTDVKEIFLWGAENYYQYLKDGNWFVWDKRIDEQMDKMFGSCFELCWSKSIHKREIVRIRWAGIFGTEKEPDKDKSRKHPTQKPVLLSNWFIKKFSKSDNVIVDMFLGSGSTLMSCEQLNRICYGMEIEPKYCDVIITRFSNFTETPEEEIRAKRENG